MNVSDLGPALRRAGITLVLLAPGIPDQQGRSHRLAFIDGLTATVHCQGLAVERVSFAGGPDVEVADPDTFPGRLAAVLRSLRP